MKPGTRVVAHAFDMGEWQPDETATTGFATAYLWIVPAQVAGRWSVTLEGGKRGTLVPGFMRSSVGRKRMFNSGKRYSVTTVAAEKFSLKMSPVMMRTLSPTPAS